MKRISPSIGICAAAAALFFALPSAALDSVKFMIPAAPGGGWDQTTRNFSAAMMKSGAVKNAQLENKGGAGGTIGLAQFVNTAKGDGNAIITGGMVMVGGIKIGRAHV